ncbi:MAG: DnaJ domain-containing protein [Sandaracinaceae bacterium]
MISKGARVPRLVEGVDLTSLPLSPLEGFVVSRIDGAASVQVLADLTNIDEDHVYEMVERLIALSAVEWARESISLPLPTGRAATRTPSREVEVPPLLRAPRPSTPGRVRMRTEDKIKRPPPPKLEGVHTSKPASEEVDFSRGSVFPSQAPRSSHTGPPHPSGELDEDLVSEGLVVPPTPPPPSFDLPPPAAAADPEDDFPAESSLERDLAEFSAALEAATAEVASRSEPVPSEAVALGADGPDELIVEEPPVEEAPREEPIELDPDRQRRVDDLYFALDLLDHYQVLGVLRTAPRNEVRTAYFQLSKVFHPDTMFRKRLGPYKGRMEAIFQRLTEAYETLGKKKARDEYDRYLEIQDRTREVERSLDEHPEQDERERLGRAAAQYEADVAAGRPPSSAEFEVPPQLRAPDPIPESDPPAATSSAPPAAPVRREMSEEGKRRQRELMAKKLRHATRATSAGRRAPSPPPAPPAPKVDKKDVLRGLASTLKQTSAQTGGVDPVTRHVAAAKRSEAEGDLAAAANYLRLALAGAPDREDLETEHARISKILSTTMAASYEEQALYEQRHGKWGAAAISWAKVFEGRPDDARAARQAAEALVEAGGDMHRAKVLAQAAADLEPDNVECLRALARVYIAAGLGLNARRVLQRAAKLDPADEMVENLLRDLGR